MEINTTFLVALSGLTALAAAILIFVISCYNKYQFSLIKISEAENNINELLTKKQDYIVRLAEIVIDNTKDTYIDLNKIKNIKNKSLNSFELYKELYLYTKDIQEAIDLDENITDIENFNIVYEEFRLNEDYLDAAKSYYNDNVVNYNKLIHYFPSNIVGKIFRYKHKDFYNIENKKQEK